MFKCDICDFNANKRIALKMHLKRKHVDSIYTSHENKEIDKILGKRKKLESTSSRQVGSLEGKSFNTCRECPFKTNSKTE